MKMAGIFLPLLVLMLFHGVGGQNSDNCDAGWTYHDGRCYMTRDEYETYENAIETCSMFGGNLAYAYDQKSLDFLTNVVKKSKIFGWWYGAKIYAYDDSMRIERLGQEQNVPATVPRPPAHQFTEPTTGCVALLIMVETYSTTEYLMMSVPCTVKLPYACRGNPSSVPQSVVTDKIHTVVASSFDTYWFSDPLDKRSYKDAQSACIQKSMTLMSLRSVSESSNITGEIGRRKKGLVDPWWIGLSVTDGAYKWTSGVELKPSVLQWKRFGDSGYNYHPPCRILLSDGTMDERSCYNTRAPFICDRYKLTSGMFGCPVNWYRAGQSCYQRSQKSYMTQVDAARLCAKSNSHLVSIDTLEEKIWLMDSVIDDIYTYFGIWTSLNDKNKLKDFRWADGSKPSKSLVEWKVSESNKFAGKCFALYTYDGSLHAYQCEKSLQPGCQYKSNNGKCVSDKWTFLNGNCYYTVVHDPYNNNRHFTPFWQNTITDEAPYNAMLQTCFADAMKYDNSLEIVPLKVDSKSVLNLFTRKNFNDIWIGLKETSRGVYQWADGTTADTSVFDTTPNTDNSTKRCTTMNYNGLFKIEDCKTCSCGLALCEKEVPYHHQN